MRTVNAIPLLAILLAAAGCRHLDPEAEPDAGTSTDTDTIVDTDTGVAGDPCSLALSETCSDVDAGLMTEVLDAEALVGSGAVLEFLALGDRAVLASLYDGTGPGPAVLFANPWIEGPDEWDHVAYMTDPESGLTAVDIAGPSGLFDAGGETILYDVLLCGDVGCGIWGVVQPPEDPELEPTDEITGLLLSELVFLTAIPIAEAATLRGIAGGYVYGDGIFLTTGDAWSIAVAPGTGGLFNDLEVWSPLGDGVGPVAVGDGGRMVGFHDGSWLPIETGTSKDLLTVAYQPNGFHAGGEDGAVVSLGGGADPQDGAVLAFAGSDAVVKTGFDCAFGAHSNEPGVTEGLTSEGCAFVLGPSGVTDCWSVPLHPGPALDIVGFLTGEGTEGKYVLTRQTLYRYGAP